MSTDKKNIVSAWIYGTFGSSEHLRFLYKGILIDESTFYPRLCEMALGNNIHHGATTWFQKIKPFFDIAGTLEKTTVPRLISKYGEKVVKSRL